MKFEVVEYLTDTPKPPAPKKKRWGRKQKFRKAVKAEAIKIVQRYIRKHVAGWQTSLPLWPEAGGRATGGAEHAIEGQQGEGEAQAEEGPQIEEEGH